MTSTRLDIILIASRWSWHKIKASKRKEVVEMWCWWIQSRPTSPRDTGFVRTCPLSSDCCCWMLLLREWSLWFRMVRSPHILSPCALILLLLFSSSSPRRTTARQRTQIRCCRPLILMVEQSRKGKKRESEAAVKKNTIKTWQFIYQVQINISFNCISGFIQCRSSGPGFWVLNSANDPLSIVLILIPN